MAQTASGFLRVAALLIATAVFATVWTGDQQTQQEFIVARKSAAQHAKGVLLSRGDATPSDVAEMTTRRLHGSNSTLARHRQSSDVSCLTAGTSYVARVEIDMRLPVGIAPGRYQVVDQSGDVRTIRVATENGPTERRDVYQLDQSDGSRRFFIRLVETAAQPRDRLLR